MISIKTWMTVAEETGLISLIQLIKSTNYDLKFYADIV